MARRHKKTTQSKCIKSFPILCGVGIPALFTVGWLIEQMYNSYTRTSSVSVTKAPDKPIDSSGKNDALIEAILHKDTAKAQEAIDQGANVNALSLVSSKKYGTFSKILEILTEEEQLNINSALNTMGAIEVPLYPVMLTCDRNKTIINFNMLSLLLKNNADPLVYFEGRSFFTCVTELINDYQSASELIKLLQKYNSSLDFNKVMFDVAPLCNEHITKYLLEEKLANPDYIDFAGNSMLHNTVFAKCYETTELLLKYGANPQIKDSEGRTPLREALISNVDSYYKENSQNLPIMHEKVKTKKPADAKVAALLIKYGGKIYTESHSKITPFKYASTSLMQDTEEKLQNMLQSDNLPKDYLENILSGLSALNAMQEREKNPNKCPDLSIDEKGYLICTGTKDELNHDYVERKCTGGLTEDGKGGYVCAGIEGE